MTISLNKVNLIGNLGRDPDIRMTNDGKEIANLNLATTESWKDKATGSKKERTEWHKIVCFNEGLTKIIKDYVRKGTKLYIEGQIQTRKWIDHDNQERYVTEIVLQNYNSNLILLDSRQEVTTDLNRKQNVDSDDDISMISKNTDPNDEIPF